MEEAVEVRLDVVDQEATSSQSGDTQSARCVFMLCSAARRYGHSTDAIIKHCVNLQASPGADLRRVENGVLHVLKHPSRRHVVHTMVDCEHD